MKAARKNKRNEPSPESLAEMPERSFREAVRGKYAGRAFTNTRMLEPDLEEAFPDSESVNRALRAVLALRDVVAREPAGARPATKRRPRAA